MSAGCGQAVSHIYGLAECHLRARPILKPSSSNIDVFIPALPVPSKMHKTPFGIWQSSTKLKSASIINMSTSVPPKGTLYDWIRREGHMTERQSVMGRDENNFPGNVILERSRQELRLNSQLLLVYISFSLITFGISSMISSSKIRGYLIPHSASRRDVFSMTVSARSDRVIDWLKLFM